MKALRGALAASLWLLVPRLVSAHADTPRRLAEVAAELAQKPGDPTLLLRRGQLYLDEEYHDYPQAIADLTAAIKDPTLVDAALFRGQAYLRSGDATRARRDLDAFIARMPRDNRGYEARAEWDRAAGDKKAAIADLATAVEINPRADLYVQRATLQLETGDHAGAVRTYEDGIARLGRPVELITAAADVAAQAGDTAKALQWIAALEALGGRPEPWTLRRAGVLAHSGHTAEAEQAYRAVLQRLDARQAGGGVLNQTMQLERAQALAGLGRRDEAKAVLAALDPTVQGRAEYQKLAAELK
jgi:tetratricopeptide (TPR) repeat protein